MKHSDQGTTRTLRGEEQPAHKDRVGTANESRQGGSSPSRQATRKDDRTVLGAIRTFAEKRLITGGRSKYAVASPEGRGTGAGQRRFGRGL
jgi:hypothetical protein